MWVAFLALSPLGYNQTRVYDPRFVSDPLFFLPGTVGFQAMVGILAVAYLAHLAYHRRLPGGSALDWPLLGVVAAYLAAIALSIYPRFSLESAFLTGSVVLTFLVFNDLDELTPSRISKGLAAVGVIGAVYALYRVGSDYSHWLSFIRSVEGSLSSKDLIPPSVPRVHDVGDHVNMIALAFNLTLPFALLAALRGLSLAGRLAGLVGVALIALALFFTVSRAAWVGGAIAIPVFAVLYRWRESGRPSLPHLPWRAVAVGSAVAVVGVLGAAAVVAARWDSRPEWLFRSSLSPRYDAFNVAIDIIRDRPWTGSGPNTFSLLYNTYSGDYPIEDFHPHNGYLAVGVDTGLVGILAVAVLGLVLLRSLWSAYADGDPVTRGLAAACIASLVALAVHSAADMPNQSKTALLLVAVIAALSMKLAPAARQPAFRAASIVPRTALLLFIPVFVVAWLWTDLGHARYDDSLGLLAKGDFAASAEKALAAADKDPDFAAYQFHAGAMQAIEYLVLQERGETRPDVLDGAIDSLRRGLKFEPRSPIGHANLALALNMRGDTEEALAEARLAMLRAPTDGTIAAVAGTIFESAQQFGEAVQAYSEAVTHDAGLIESPFWGATQFRRDARGEILSRTFLTACQKARVVALYNRYGEDRIADFAQGCRESVAAAPGDARARADLAVALYRMSAGEEAESEARRAVRQAPDNAYARTALGFVLMDSSTAAEAKRQLALGLDLGDPDAAILLSIFYESRFLSPDDDIPTELLDRMETILPDSAAFVYDSGIQDYLLGILYYRPRYFRESPLSILIPGDWLNLVSPRTVLIQQALKEAGRR